MNDLCADAPIRNCHVLAISDRFLFRSSGVTLFAILSGRLSLDEKQTLSSGTIFFCFPGETPPHPSEPCILLSLGLDNVFFLDQIPELMEFPSSPCVPGHTDELFSRLRSYAHSFLTGGCSSCQTYALAFLLLEALLCERPAFGVVSALSGKEPFFVSSRPASRSTLLLQDVLDYTQKNLANDIGLSGVSAHFSCSPQYLSEIIKEYLGTTFQKYLRALRLKKAASYVRYTDLCDHTIVTRLHLKTKEVTPLRSEWDPYVPLPENSGFHALNREAALAFLSAPSDPGSTVPDTERVSLTSETDSRILFPVWNQLINLGYASAFRDAQISRQMIWIQKQIHFHYGRICRIFDLVTSYLAGNKRIYDFNPVFRIFDICIANDIYPFIELGNKRMRIQFTQHESVITDFPDDEEEHFQHVLNILPSFICASINRYGYDSVSKWMFEVSSPVYESLGETTDFTTYKYIQYFCRIKELINSYVPECRVGGPGFNNWASIGEFERLVVQFCSAPCMPDFFTSYLYSVEKDDSASSLSPDPDILEKRMRLLMGVIESICPGRELWITEFNSNLSSRNYLNDSCYQALFITHSLFAAIRCGVKAMGYYLMSDIPLRYVDTTDLLFGGWGLFSDSNLPKPSFHAWRLFSMLGREQSAMNENCIITRSANDACQCLLYHYEHVAPDYCGKNITREDFFLSDQLFKRRPSDSLRLVFPALPPGYYLTTRYVISARQSNLLFQWYQLHFLTPVREKDLELLRQQSELIPETACIEVAPDVPLMLDCTLSHQEIQLITIEPFHTSASDQKGEL